MIRWVTNWPSSALPKWQSRQMRGAGARILERDEAARDVGGVGAADRIMARTASPRPAPWQLSQPTPSEVWKRAPRGPAGVAWQPRHIGALGRLADAEPLGDRLRARLAQHRPGAAVRAGGGRRILPEHDLVLADDRAVAFAAAVAGGAAAGGDADIGGAARMSLGDRLRAVRAEQEEQPEQGGDERQRAKTDDDVAAAPHLPSMPPALPGQPKKVRPKLWAETASPCNPQRPPRSPLTPPETIPGRAWVFDCCR